MAKTQNFPVRLDTEVIEKIKKEAKKTGRTAAGLVRFIIEQYINNLS